MAESVLKTNRNTIDMTQGSIWKHIVMFAIPIFLSNLFQQLYNTADSLIVGNFLDRNALAAVSSSGSLIFLFTSFFVGTFMGAGVVISRFFGMKDYESMQRAIHTNIAFGLVSSILLTVLGVLLTPTILRWMGTDPEVLPESITYFRWYFFGVTGVIMYNAFNGVLQAVGNSRRGLLYLGISSMMNVALDYLFIGVIGWGVWSAAFATAISQFTSCILCLTFLLKKGTVYCVSFSKIRFHKDMLLLIFQYGIPSGIQNSVIAIANVFVQSNINSFGANAMAGCGSYAKMEGFVFLPITSFTMAITTFVGQNLGAGNSVRAKSGAKFGVITSVILAEVVGLIMYIGCPIFIRMFISGNDDQAIVNEVVGYGILQTKTESLFYFLLAFSHCIAAVCRGAGKAVVPMGVMLVDWCGIRVAYITIALGISHDIKLLFMAYPITWGISSIFFLFYFLFSHWAEKAVYRT